MAWPSLSYSSVHDSQQSCLDLLYRQVPLRGHLLTRIGLDCVAVSSMHFAFPPRKSSSPPAYAARSSRNQSYPGSNYLRRTSRLQQLLILVLGAFTTLWLLSKLFSGSSSPSIPSGTPKAVVVTTLDPSLSTSYKEAIKANRKHYADKHGIHPSLMSNTRRRTYNILQAMSHSSPTRPTTPLTMLQPRGPPSPPSDTP